MNKSVFSHTSQGYLQYSSTLFLLCTDIWERDCARQHDKIMTAEGQKAESHLILHNQSGRELHHDQWHVFPNHVNMWQILKRKGRFNMSKKAFRQEGKRSRKGQIMPTVTHKRNTKEHTKIYAIPFYTKQEGFNSCVCTEHHYLSSLHWCDCTDLGWSENSRTFQMILHTRFFLLLFLTMSSIENSNHVQGGRQK